MSKSNLDAIVNAYSPSKGGDRTSITRDKFSTLITKGLSEDYRADARLGKGTFTAIVLRVEDFSELDDSSGYPYEPGSLAMKKYNDGSSEAPKLVAVKARIPFLHNMLPIPDLTWSNLEGDCPSKGQTREHIKRCHHAIIDMYPTFYAEKEDMLIPMVGEMVRVKFGDVDNNRDPVLLGSESGNTFSALKTTKTKVYGTSGSAVMISSSGANSSGHTGGSSPIKLTDEEIKKAGENFKGPWGKIITKDGKYSYQLTNEDVFWATKMVIGEGDHLEAVLWSMASLLVWFNIYNKALKGYSYYGLITEYSQPIAPKWRRDGFKCRDCTPKLKRTPKHRCTKCLDPMLDRRDRYASLTISDLVEKHAKQLALTIKWAKGEVSNPYPGCTDFAQGSVARRNIPLNLGGLCNLGNKCVYDYVSFVDKNKRPNKAVWYVGRKGASTWDPNYVKIVVDPAERKE